MVFLARGTRLSKSAGSWEKLSNATLILIGRGCKNLHFLVENCNLLQTTLILIDSIAVSLSVTGPVFLREAQHLFESFYFYARGPFCLSVRGQPVKERRDFL